jgi:hypothetical protein
MNSSSPSAPFLQEWWSFWLDSLGWHCFAIFVKQVEGLLLILGVLVVANCKIILQVCLQSCMLLPNLLKKNIWEVSLFGICADSLLFLLCQIYKL